MLVDMLALCTMLNWTEYDVVHAPGQTGKNFHVATVYSFQYSIAVVTW